ncbi:MAG: hypothetical protein ACO3ZY_14390, partial [Phycisphaerales bacterium]
MPEPRWIDAVAKVVGGPARCWCISLARRPDRWRDFVERCPIMESVDLLDAVDGNECLMPATSRVPSGAWGCLQSHLRILRRALVEGYDRLGGAVVVLEDDAVFADDFRARSLDLLARTPAGWDMVYLGGQHTHGRERHPRRVAEGIVQAYSVNRTQAYVIRGAAISIAYRHLDDLGLIADAPHRHVDHRLEELHR